MTLDELAAHLEDPDTASGAPGQWSYRDISKSQVTAVVLVFVGFLAAILYKKPAEDCAADNEEICAGVISTAIGSQEAVSDALFTAGLLTFGVINAFFSGESVAAATDFVQKQKIFNDKVLAIIELLVLTLIQCTSFLILAEATDSSVFETVLSVLGAAPGALYMVAKSLQVKIPLALSKANYYYNAAYYRLYDAKTETEFLAWEKLKYYHATIGHFKQSNQKKMQYISANVKDLKTAGLTPADLNNTLRYLLKQPKATDINHFADNTGKVVGIPIAVLISYPFVNACVGGLDTFDVPTLELQIPLALVLTASSTYGNFDVLIRGTKLWMDFIQKSLQCQTPNSLAYNIFPKLTTGVTITMAFISAGSFALMVKVANKAFPDGASKPYFILVSSAGICVYHWFGQSDFYNLLLRRFSKDFMYEVENTKLTIDNTTTEKFIDVLENPDYREFRSLVGEHVPVFDPSTVVIPERLKVQADLEAGSDSAATVTAKPKTSLFDCLATLYAGSKRKADAMNDRKKLIDPNAETRRYLTNSSVLN